MYAKICLPTLLIFSTGLLIYTVLLATHNKPQVRNTVTLENRAWLTQSDKEKSLDKNSDYHYLVVMVLSIDKHSRHAARRHWYNEADWRRNGANIRILYILGRAEEADYDERETADIIFTNVSESRDNLIHKVRQGMQYIHNTLSYEYILKTDDDMFHNFELWERTLLEHNKLAENTRALYGGPRCTLHLHVPYRWCSGMGYVVHHSVVHQIAHYPVHLLEEAEDRSVGKIAHKLNLGITSIASGMITFRRDFCARLSEILSEKAAIHLGFGGLRTIDSRVECWKNFKFEYQNDKS